MKHATRLGLFALAAGLLLGGVGPVLAQGAAGGDAGSGLSPGASATGNDRSAGVNNGNYRRPGSYGTRGSFRSSYGRPRRIGPHRRHRF
ncbi:hypothetical protein [Methylobacterium sp. Leaf118]|uniref:hypothetical protein n=1 Tax=Methylobacterium sp. Leaf118 TaxID=2876562 RepID=UPI001E2DAE6B|nr:hypothetical protein [Methylobacterium sp. Leaf118]